MNEKDLEYHRKWRAENKEKVKAASEKYREAHRSVLVERWRNYDKEHRDKRNANARENRHSRRDEISIARKELRKKAIDYYGGKCACCGESTYEFLAIDHINGGGHKHRKEIKGRSIGAWLKKNNYPDGFQVLCHNCNQAKGLYGKCPHQKGVK